jgi:hypothetical protein
MNMYQLIALVSAALAVAAGSWDAYRLRREQRYSAMVMAITAGGPILSLWLYLTLTGLQLKPIVGVGLMVAGAAAGVYAANRATLSEAGSGGQMRMVGASWLPLPAAMCVAAVQVSGAVTLLAAQVFSLAALEAAVAFGVASAVTLLYRRASFAQARPQPGMPAVPPPT